MIDPENPPGRVARAPEQGIGGMSVETVPAPFWLVWSPTGSMPPRYQHSSFASACNEAARLARENPGKVFFSVQPVARYVVPSAPMDVVRYSLDAADDGIPF